MIYLKCSLGLFLAISLIQSASCIKCFDCQSSIDPKCADPFDNSTVPITNCIQANGLTHLSDVGFAVCRKMRRMVNGEVNYIRGCAYADEVGVEGDEKICVMKTETDNIVVEYCTCISKDGCNSSSVFSPIPLLILISLFSLIYNYGASK